MVRSENGRPGRSLRNVLDAHPAAPGAFHVQLRHADVVRLGPARLAHRAARGGVPGSRLRRGPRLTVDHGQKGYCVAQPLEGPTPVRDLAPSNLPIDRNGGQVRHLAYCSWAAASAAPPQLPREPAPREEGLYAPALTHAEWSATLPLFERFLDLAGKSAHLACPSWFSLPSWSDSIPSSTPNIGQIFFATT